MEEIAEQGAVPALEVTLDLVAEDQALREVIGAPLVTRIARATDDSDGVITIPHMKDWPYTGSRFLTNGFWEAWAQSVLSEDDARKFAEANLKTYQLERLEEMINAANGISAGKPSRSSGSPGSTKPR